MIEEGRELVREGFGMGWDGMGGGASVRPSGSFAVVG